MNERFAYTQVPEDEVPKRFAELKRIILNGEPITPLSPDEVNLLLVEKTPEKEKGEWDHIKPIEENEEAMQYQKSRPDLFE